MDRHAILAVGLGGVAAYLAMREYADVTPAVATPMKIGNFSTFQLDRRFDSLNWYNIRRVKPLISDLLRNRQVQAFLRVIREKESSQDDAIAYRIMIGWPHDPGFTELAPPELHDHPRKYNPKRDSTAAGAYQFLASSWDDMAKELGLSGFYPGNQDRAAVGQLAYLGALNHVLAGRIDAALRASAVRQGWASLPGGVQAIQTMAGARAVFERWGGVITQ